MNAEKKKNIQILLSTEKHVLYLHQKIIHSRTNEFVLRKKKAVSNDTAHSLEFTTYEK